MIRLLHDSSFKQNIEHCSTKDCYHLGIRYANSMDEIEAVIRVSNSCEQRIQVRKVQITSIRTNVNKIGILVWKIFYLVLQKYCKLLSDDFLFF